MRLLVPLLAAATLAGCTTGPITLADPSVNPAVGPDSRPVEARTPAGVLGPTGFGRPAAPGQGVRLPVTGSNAMPQSRNSVP